MLERRSHGRLPLRIDNLERRLGIAIAALFARTIAGDNAGLRPSSVSG
jgi:hypothetical protein